MSVDTYQQQAQTGLGGGTPSWPERPCPTTAAAATPICPRPAKMETYFDMKTACECPRKVPK